MEQTENLPGLPARLAAVMRRIGESAAQSGRSPDAVKLIAVSKTQPLAAIREAIGAGAIDFGENRVQEAEEKINAIERAAARWHLIGPLQANKVRRAVKLFDVIHSLDSVDLANRLDRICGEEERPELPVLIQVSLANEASKSGVAEADLDQLVATVQTAKRLRLIGFMTLPPFDDDAEAARPYFRRLRELRDRFAGDGAFGASAGELSMGMSHDFPVAIEEGASLVRVGTAIFGERIK